MVDELIVPYEPSRFTWEGTVEKAAKLGLHCVTPEEDELFIDIDNSADFAVFEVLFAILKEELPDATWVARPSKSGGDRKHVVVFLGRPVANHSERLLLEASLGSDRKRALIAWRSLLRGHPNPSVFFEKEPIARTVNAEVIQWASSSMDPY